MQTVHDRRVVFDLDPLTDPRWPHFLARHPDASIFHTKEWLSAIRNTYGYEPVVFTTSEKGELSNGVVFCRIRSWLTGRRLVSLPFSDHCQPLAARDDLAAILHSIKRGRRLRMQKYVELRPAKDDELGDTTLGFSRNDSFYFHNIDLRPDLNSIYSRFHESCIRRKIKRAEREELRYESGRSDELLQRFRHLLFLTRRRHKLPPQPAEWFRNIAGCLGEMATIHLVSKGDIPVASIMTFSHKKTLVYKYGCSDGQFSNMGGTPMLFWKAIQQAKEADMQTFDLGRSDLDEPGLIAFKEHLGAIPSKLNYYRDVASPTKEEPAKSTMSLSSLAREALMRLPDPLLAGVGQLLYRHIG